MDEKEAVDKMRDLKKSLETTLRYERSGSKFPAVFLITLLAILAANIISLSANVYNLVTINSSMGYLSIENGDSVGIGVLVVILFGVIAVIVYRILHKPFTKPVENSWDEYLKEGVIGIIRIIEESDWERILVSLKKAKQAFIVISSLSILLELGIIFALLFFAYGILISGVFGITPNLYIVLLGSVLLMIALGDRTIKQSYSELWHMDNLVAELRWFYFEFQGAGI
jgi:hypothetical protein